MLTPKNFFIIGSLPRSGSAWLSTALNLHPDIMCFHEAAVSYIPYIRRMTDALVKHKVVVDCTSGLLPAFDEVPATRLFLDRDQDQCKESTQKVLGTTDATWSQITAMADAWRKLHAPMSFNYTDLFHPTKQMSVIGLILVSMGLSTRTYPAAKLASLGILNVQINGLGPHYYDGKIIQSKP